MGCTPPSKSNSSTPSPPGHRLLFFSIFLQLCVAIKWNPIYRICLFVFVTLKCVENLVISAMNYRFNLWFSPQSASFSGAVSQIQNLWSKFWCEIRWCLSTLNPWTGLLTPFLIGSYHELFTYLANHYKAFKTVAPKTCTRDYFFLLPLWLVQYMLEYTIWPISR